MILELEILLTVVRAFIAFFTIALNRGSVKVVTSGPILLLR
jgi:hypothetical protein